MVGEPHPAILACAHQAEAGARLAAEFVSTQRRARTQYRHQHAVACLGAHPAAVDQDPHLLIIRPNRTYQPATHDCLTAASARTRMLADHAASFNPAFDSGESRAPI